MVTDIVRGIAGESRPPDAAGRVELIRRSARLNTLLMTIALPGIWMFAALLWNHAPRTGLLTWTIGMSVSLVFTIVRDVWALRQDDPDQYLLNEGVLRFTLPIASIALASVTIVAMPEDPAWQVLLVIVVVGSMAGNVVVNSAIRSLFYLAQIPLGVTGVIGFALSGSPVAPAIIATMLYAMAASFGLAMILRRSAEDWLSIARENGTLVSELHQSNEDLVERANTDSLTGLLNRSGFVAELGAILAGEKVEVRPGDPQPEHIAVLYLDLNRFKAVNDSLGHAAGDELLIQAAARLRAHVRPSDVVARIGGDELTIAALGIRSAAEAYSFAERVNGAFAAPFELAGVKRSVGASIGVAFGLIGEFDTEELLASSDAALYAAKASSTSNVEVFDDAARTRASHRRTLKRDVSAALDQQQIVAHWQPIMCTSTGALEGIEGLARWHDNGRLRSAGEFVDAVIEAGFEGRLTDAMIGETVRARHRIEDRSTLLGLNVTPSLLGRLLDHPELLDVMDGLVVEITEQGVIGDVDAASRILATARSRGCRIFLDDFGTGYSSLSMIADLPLDGVKIDRRFIATIDNPQSHKIVADISEIGRRHGLTVVAEGVETVKQLEAVRELGIPLVQGYLLGRPMATDDVISMMSQHTRPWDHLFVEPVVDTLSEPSR